MTTAQDDNDDYKDDLPRYQVRLLIRHPNIDPDRITNALGLTPQLSAMVGTVRKNPRGDILPGLHKDSVWSHWFQVEGNRRFFSDIVKLIDKLEPCRTLLAEIERGGGTICLILDLPGDTNIGDVFSWREMMRLSSLRIDLGIEVFPEFS